MYRIELAPGEVTVFRTIEELATGVRNGLITSKARIYHGASEKWLPIEFHPHYKRALGLASGRATEPPSPKPAPKSRASKSVDHLQPETLTFLSVPLAPVVPAPGAPSPSVPAPAVHSPAAHSSNAPTPLALEPTSAPAPMLTSRPPAPEPPATLAAPHAPPQPQPTAPESIAPLPPAPQSFAPLPSAPQSFAPLPPAPEPIVLPWAAKSPVEPAPAEPAPASFLARLEAARVTEDEPAEHAPAEWLARSPAPLPPVSASPVLELPKITYPEFTPREEPVAERSSGGSRRRVLHLVGAVALLAAGGYASTTLLSLSRSESPFVAATTLADRPTVPAATRPPAPFTTRAPAPFSTRPPAPPATSPATTSRATSPAAAASAAGSPGLSAAPAPKTPPRAATPAPKPASAPVTAPAPAPGAPLPPASSGFARALEPRAIVSTPPKTEAAKPADVAGDSTAIAPPQIDLKVAAPVVPGADLVGATRPKSDSAMKKILRAVSGGKDAR